jgi:hypothetical protein
VQLLQSVELVLNLISLELMFIVQAVVVVTTVFPTRMAV